MAVVVLPAPPLPLTKEMIILLLCYTTPVFECHRNMLTVQQDSVFFVSFTDDLFCREPASPVCACLNNRLCRALFTPIGTVADARIGAWLERLDIHQVAVPHSIIIWDAAC